MNINNKKSARAIRAVAATLAMFVLAAAFRVSVSAVTNSNEVYNWYCIRTSGNKRPPCPPEMSFITKHHCYYIDDKRSDDDRDKVIYLTFDAGYENGNVEKTLDILKEKGVSAAFFILGNLISSNGELVKRMSDDGHLVCNHTYHHRDMSRVASKEEFVRELASLENAYRELTGAEISKYYRPPEGRFSENNLNYAEEMGYSTVFWSFAYADWDNNKQPSAEYAVNKITSNVHNGAVVLLHPTSATNVEILPTIIDFLKDAGYRFGALDELCASSSDTESLQ